MTKKIAIFHHIYPVNHWEKVVKTQNDLIDRIPNRDYYPFVADLNQKNEFELPSLINLWEYSRQTNENVAICYLHTKGVTRPKERKIRLWRDTLNFWTLYKWRENIALLESYDTSGPRFYDFKQGANHYPHYSGNFWWANSEYIKQLPHPGEFMESYKPDHKKDKDPSPQRYALEFWIGSGQASMAVVDNYIVKGKVVRGFSPFWWLKMKHKSK